MSVTSADRVKKYRSTEKGINAQYKYKYGITLEDYDKMFDEQGGRCAICGDTTETRLFVDHDHSCCSGRPACGNCVRGLLCGRCNKALGFFRDDIDSLKSAITYLGGDI